MSLLTKINDFDEKILQLSSAIKDDIDKEDYRRYDIAEIDKLFAIYVKDSNLTDIQVYKLDSLLDTNDNMLSKAIALIKQKPSYADLLVGFISFLEV